LLRSVFELLNSSGVPYCILHGYQEYPTNVVSDVDCIVPAESLPRQLAMLLRANEDLLGARLVQWMQHEATANYFVLATDGVAAPREFLAVDVSSDFRTDGRVFYGGEAILASRCLDRGFWVPAPAIEFGSYLVKRIAKRCVRPEHACRLSELYKEDPKGSDREIARFWQGDSVRLIRSVAASGEWDALRKKLGSLRRELLWPGTPGEVRSSVRYWAADAVRRLRRWREPTGVHVVFLGADGSGKSTTLAAVGHSLAPAFRRVTMKHLAPGLFRSARAGVAVAAPQSFSPRSLVGSLAKAAYWILDYALGYYLTIRPALARSTLVLYDRYLVDALIDPRRYRYGGPRWLLRLAWRLVPKPDLVVLLDAPTEVLRARKQEVSVGETERQRHAYRELLGTLPKGHVVDAAQPLDGVVKAVGGVVLGFLASRTARRLGESR
jgi:thymidylate kinase